MKLFLPYTLSALAFLITATLIPIIRKVARGKGWVAQPKKDRWHKKPTALMGGIAIYAGYSIPLLFAADFNSLKLFQNMSTPSLPAIIWLGITFLFGIGLFDDFRNIKPHSKLLAQILAASLVVFFGLRLNWFESLTLDTVITLFWIIGITNAYNLLDNMDGLCSGVGLISAFFVALLFFGSSNPDHTVFIFIALTLCGALAGFLIYNFNPASIFMGDCGSLIIGFSLAVLSLCFSKAPSISPIAIAAVPILLQLVPIFDTTLVTSIRLLSGRKASQGGSDHASHRLVLMGLSERQAVLFLYMITASAGAAALFVSRADTLTSPAVIIPVVIAILLMGIYMAQLRVYPEKEFSLLLEKPYTPILRELTYKKQLLLVVLDLCLIIFSYYLSYRLRFDAAVLPYYFTVFLHSLPAIIVCKFTALFIVGVYRSIWDFMSAQDVLVQVKGSILATLLCVVVVTFIYRFKDFSKGIFLIDWMLTTGFLIGTRGSFRLFFDFIRRKRAEGDCVIIYGAGRGGELLLREILHNQYLNIKPIGFIDDDQLKKGKKIQGYPIIGSINELKQIHAEHQLRGVILSFNNEQGRYKNTHSAVEEFCRKNNLWLKQFKIDLKNIHLPDEN